MTNDIVAVASIGLELDIAVSNRDGSSFFGLSLTFRIDVIIFAGLPASKSGETIPPVKKSLFETDPEAYLQNKKMQLKKLYDGWENYLKTYQSRITGTVFKSMEEFEGKMKEIVSEQVAVRAKIEEIIDEVGSALKTAGQDKKTLDGVLKFLSNCYQIIRDLSLTFDIGQYSMEVGIEPSERADAIRSELQKKYAQYAVMEKIKKRRSLSEAINAKKQEITELKNTILSDEGKLNALRENGDAEQKKLVCRNNALPLVEEAVKTWNALEMDSLKNRLIALGHEIAVYEKEIGDFSVSKNKREQAAAEQIKGFLSKAQQEKSALEKKIEDGQFSTTKNEFAYLCKDKAKEDPALSGIGKKMQTTKTKITGLETKIKELLAEYETIVKDFA